MACVSGVGLIVGIIADTQLPPDILYSCEFEDHERHLVSDACNSTSIAPNNNYW